MSGVAPDPLDRIAWRAPNIYGHIHVTREERDALVKVVRAARPIAEWLKQIGIDMSIEGAAQHIADAQAFMAAVARLDKDTA